MCLSSSEKAIIVVCYNSQCQGKRFLLGTAGKTPQMVAGQFLNKIVNKLLKSVQNWKSYFEYANAHFFMGHCVVSIYI